MYKSMNSKQRDILITMLLMANHKENQWEYKGEIYTVKPGQFVTSLEEIRKNCAKDVTVQNIRTALNKLKTWGFLTWESTNKNRLVTIVKWDFYQGCQDETNKQANKQLTNNQQTTNKQLTTNKNDKNDKNEKEMIIDDENDQSFWDDLKQEVEQGKGLANKPKSDYEKYFDQIEEYFNYKKGSYYPFSKPNDLEAIKRLFEIGISLEEVKKAIDYAFRKKGKRINSFSYCAAIIFNRLEENEMKREQQKNVVPFKKQQPQQTQMPKVFQPDFEPEEPPKRETTEEEVKAKIKKMMEVAKARRKVHP